MKSVKFPVDVPDSWYFRCLVHGDVGCASTRVAYEKYQWWCVSCQKWVDAVLQSSTE